MPEHEPWLTALFNDHLAGVANGVLSMLGLKTSERPWSTPMCMELLVAVIIGLGGWGGGESHRRRRL